MDLPSERNRAANKDGPLLINFMITYFSERSQIIYGYFLIKILGKGIIHTASVVRKDKNGNAIGYQGTINDITELVTKGSRSTVCSLPGHQKASCKRGSVGHPS